MTVILVPARVKYRGLASEMLAFSPGGIKQAGAEYFCIDTKVYYAWDGAQWVLPVPLVAPKTVMVQALTSSPVDGQTIYFGNLPKAPVTTGGISRVYMYRDGTIKVAEIHCYSGTAGSNQAWSCYLRVNNTTDYFVATVSVSANERRFNQAALNIAVLGGDYIEVKMVNPTWTTNPATCIFGGYLVIE